MSTGSAGPGCALCQRSGLFLKRGHLIPRTRHRNERNKREFERDHVKLCVLRACRRR